MKGFYISKTADAKDLPLPKYMTKGSAGMDLYANIHDETAIKKGEIKLVPCGVKIALPCGYEAQIRPRSGLALNFGITLVNSPGTIDADYRGEIKVILINHGNDTFYINRGDRIAQIVICHAAQIVWHETYTLPESGRNEDGFGHTGFRQ